MRSWVNGVMVDDRPSVDMYSYVVNYCSSVFEGIRVYRLLDQDGNLTGERAIWLLDEHLNRLYESATAYGMSIPYPIEQLAQACIDVAVQDPDIDYLRPVVFRGVNPDVGHGIGVNAAGVEVTTAILPVKMGRYSKKFRHNGGLSVYVTDVIRPRAHYPGQVKGGPNYAVYSEPACRQATAAEASEALLLGRYNSRDCIIDGPGANFYIVRGGIVLTPNPQKWNILGGKTQQILLREILPMLKITWGFDEIRAGELVNADEAFFSGTAMEVDAITAEVTVINGERAVESIGTGAPGNVTQKIQLALSRATRGQDARFYAHLTRLPQVSAVPA